MHELYISADRNAGSRMASTSLRTLSRMSRGITLVHDSLMLIQTSGRRRAVGCNGSRYARGYMHEFYARPSEVENPTFHTLPHCDGSN